MPETVRQRVEELGGFKQTILRAIPGLAKAASVFRNSTSSGLFNKDSGEQFEGSGGCHGFMGTVTAGTRAIRRSRA